jgi:hypothetical protein
MRSYAPVGENGISILRLKVADLEIHAKINVACLASNFWLCKKGTN